MLSVIFIIAGVAMIVYAEPIQRVTGDIAFAEDKLGVGGTFGFIKLIGVICIFGGFTWLSGAAPALFQSIFQPFNG